MKFSLTILVNEALLWVSLMLIIKRPCFCILRILWWLASIHRQSATYGSAVGLLKSSARLVRLGEKGDREVYTWWFVGIYSQ